MERNIGQTTNKETISWPRKTNYRPVSNLRFISKIVEQVTLIQFAEHCNKSRLLPTYLFVYRKNHSYETSLVNLVDDILWGMEEQLATAVVILDLSTAFNTVDHDLLQDILEKKFGIIDNTKEWYQNYIRSGKSWVIIGEDKFKPKQLYYSVPQGSIQGAFLFISYASTLKEIIKDLTISGYADDHSIRKTFKSS